MILSQYVDIYVSESAFYLYQRKEYWDDVVTQIAKFDLSDGKMNAVGAVSANGRVTEVSLSDDAVRMCDVRGKDKAGCIKYRAVGPEQQKPDRVDKMQDQGTGQYHEENEASGDPVFGGQH